MNTAGILCHLVPCTMACALMVAPAVALAAPAQTIAATATGPLGSPNRWLRLVALDEAAPAGAGAIDPTALAALAQQLKHGKISPEDAWKSGLLTAPFALELLRTQALDGNFADSPINLVPRIAGLLMANDPTAVPAPEKMSLNEAQAFASYDEILGDRPGAIALSQRILALSATPFEKGNALNSLAYLYLFWHEPDEALKQFAAARLLFQASNHAHYAAETLYVSGTTMEEAGRDAEAAHWFDLAVHDGDGETSAQATAALAHLLLSEGKIAEAKALIQGALAQPAGYDRDKLNYELELAVYREGNFDEAERLINSSKPTDDNWISLSYSLLGQIAVWRKSPVQFLPPTLLIYRPRREFPLTREITVRTLNLVPLTVTSNQPWIHLTQESASLDGTLLFATTKFTVTLDAPPPGAAETEAEITVAVNGVPAGTGTLKVHVQIVD